MSGVVDPLASLKSWPLTVTVGDADYRLVPASAAQWLVVLLEDPLDLAQILPGMIHEEDEEGLEEAMMEGRVSEAEIRDACWEIITACSGRDWWWAFNLVRTVSTVWMQVYGRLMAGGLDLEGLPLGAALDVMYAICIERMDREHRNTFDRELSRVPAGVEQQLDENAEEARFLALMNGQ